MIPVSLAPEPKGFDKDIRQPGLSAIDELVGRAPRIKRRGRRRAAIAATESRIPADKFPPFWRNALDDMMTAYEQRCAYLAMFIEETGGPPWTTSSRNRLRGIGSTNGRTIDSAQAS